MGRGTQLTFFQRDTNVQQVGKKVHNIPDPQENVKKKSQGDITSHTKRREDNCW